jgi:hypothetical protein
MAALLVSNGSKDLGNGTIRAFSISKYKKLSAFIKGIGVDRDIVILL